MLGLNKYKQLIGENETDYHLNATNYRFCRYCIFKPDIWIWMKIIFNKGMVA